MAANPVSDLLDACEKLHASSASGPELKRVLDADAQLQAAATAALKQRERNVRAKTLMQSAEAAQSALLRLAKRMHAVDGQLAAAREQASAALAAADEASAANRQASVSTLIEYAERVSYSNAAPCGTNAFDGAARSNFFHGWGRPSPQQHMIAASSFARPANLAGGGSSGANEEAPAAPPPPARSASDAPTFNAVAPPQQAAPKTGGVSLSLGGDDSDDDD